MGSPKESEWSERRLAKLRRRMNRSPTPFPLPSNKHSLTPIPSYCIRNLVLNTTPLSPPRFSDLSQQLPEPDKQAHRGFLESQLHDILAELDKTPSTTLSLRQRLESQAHDILRLLNGLPPEPCTCPQHPDTAKDLGEARADKSKDMHFIPVKVPKAYLPLLRKASQLCQKAEAEVYMKIRIDGRFYVYNSVDPASRLAFEPSS
ncbi:hypothetical protein PtrM4_105610 [Pyrenophora tritici-repentis]|uniref:Uncharacterized protein n=1 Tax=Pyrenophora tritici-repentis TaxID=45151 RepID=A0A834RV88_9PLEO|nr:hypothetical protein PtrM4_105610 [Pyrenophora tritici-repentis]